MAFGVIICESDIHEKKTQCEIAILTTVFQKNENIGV